MLLPFERRQTDRFRKRGIQIEVDESATQESDMDNKEDIVRVINSAQLQVRSGHAILTPNAEAASRAFLAYYIANSEGLKPAAILEYAQEFAQCTGLLEMPAMESKLAARLGLEGLLKVE